MTETPRLCSKLLAIEPCDSMPWKGPQTKRLLRIGEEAQHSHSTLRPHRPNTCRPSVETSDGCLFPAKKFVDSLVDALPQAVVIHLLFLNLTGIRSESGHGLAKHATKAKAVGLIRQTRALHSL